MIRAKILIVASESSTSPRIQKRLQSLGCAAPTIVSAEQIVTETAPQNQADLVLAPLSVQSRKKDIEAVKQFCTLHDMPVVYLLAKPEQDLLEQMREATGAGCLVEPFGDAELLLAIERAMSRHRLQTQHRQLSALVNSVPGALLATDADGAVTFVNEAAERFTGWQSREVLGKDVSLVFQLIDGQTRQPVAIPAPGGPAGGKFGHEADHILLVRRDGAEVPVAGQVIRVVDHQKGRFGLVLSFRDVTDRRQGEEALRRRAESLDMLQETILDITIRRDLSTLLHTIVERAAHLLGAPIGGLYVSEPEQSQVRCLVSYNTVQDYRGTVLRYGEGASGTVAQTGKPVNVSDYRNWAGRAAIYENEKPFTAVLAVPMLWQNQVIGVLDVSHYKEGRRFNQSDLELLTLFANHAAIAVENARLHDQAREEIAERKKAEEALRHSEAQHRAILNALGDAIHVVDGNLRIVHMNATFIEWNRELGLTTDVLGKRLSEVFPFLTEQALAEYHRVFETGQLLITEENTALGEREIITETRKIPIVEGARVTKVVTAIRDITERKTMEEALLESEEQYRTLVENVSIGVYRTTPGPMGRLLMANPAFLSMFGLASRRELAEITVADLYANPRDRQQFSNRLLDQGSVIGEVLQLRKRDGTPLWGSVTARVVHDAEGQVSYFDCTIEDITERERAAEEIRWLKEFNEGIVQNMAEGIAVQGRDGYLTFVNPAAASLLGYQVSELVGQHWHVLMPPDQYPIVEAADRRRQAGESDRYEVELVRRDGARIPALVSGSPRFRNGEFDGTMAVFTDISDRVRAEAEIRQRTTQLEALREMGLELAAELNLDDLLQSIVSRAVELAGGTSGGLYLYRPERERLEWVTCVGENLPALGTVRRRGNGLAGKVWEKGEPLLAGDYHRWAEEPAEQENNAPRSAVGVPVRWGDEFLGVLEVMSDLPASFSTNDAELLALLATQAAIAIENARLFQAERAAHEQAQTLQAATQALTATLDLQRVFELILAELRRVVPYDSATVQQFQGDKLVIIGGHGFPKLEDLLGVSFDPTATDNPNREVVLSRAPLILEDAPAHYAEFKRDPHAQAGTRSWLGVPLLFGDRLIGMLALDKQEPGFYTQAHARLALAFAAQAAIAIENARLFQAEREQRRLAETLREVASVLNTSLDDKEIIDLILDQLARVVKYDSASLMLLAGEHLEIAAHRGIYPQGTALPVFELEGFAHLREVLETRRPSIIPDTAADVRWQHVDATEDLRCWLGVPLGIQDRIIGLLSLGTSQAGFYAQRDAELAVAFATQAAIAIENARLFQAEREQRELANRLRETALLVNSSLDRQDVLELILDQLARVVPYDSGAIHIVERNATQVIATRNLPDWQAGRRYPLDEYDYNRRLVEEKKPIVVRDVQRGQEDWVATDGLEQVRSNIGVPLQVRERVIGLLTIDSHQAGAYTATEAQIAQAFAQQAATAIENTRLFQAEREQRDLAEGLRKATAAISSTLDLEQVLDQILEQVKRVIPSDAANVMLIEQNQARIVRWRGYEHFGSQKTVDSLVFDLKDTPNLRHVYETREPLLVAETTHFPGWVNVPQQDWLRSNAAAPICARNRVIGFLNLDSATPDFFSPAHLERLRLFADQASLALEHARLYKAEQRRAKEAAIVSAVAQALNAITDMKSVSAVVAQELRRLVDFDRLSLALLTEDGEQFVTYIASDEKNKALGGGKSLPVSASAAAEDILAGRPHITPDLAAERAFDAERALCEDGLRSRLNLPLSLGQAVIGALNLASRRPNAFSPEQLPLLVQISDAVSATVQTVRLYEKVVQRNRELTLLNRIIAASAASQEIEKILGTVCRELALAFGVPQSAAALFNADKTAAVVVAEYLAPGRPPSLGETIPVAGNLASQHLLRSKEPLVVDNAQTDLRLAPVHDLMRRRETVSLLLLPLAVEGQVVGSLGVDALEMRPFSDEEVNLAWRVAEQVSGSLARARLVENQRRLSAAIEQAVEGIVITDTQGKILYVNPAYEQITGNSPAEVIGTFPDQWVADDIAVPFYQDLWPTAMAGHPWHGQFIGTRREDERYTVDLTVTPVRNETGDIVNYVATLRDVTRELRLEEQFHQAQKMEALGQLAGGIAHDFNNLLTIIHLSTQLLRRTLRPEDPLWEHVTRIEETGQRAAQLTKQLLSFSRREIIEPKLVSLNQVIRELGSMLQRIIGEDIRLRTKLAQDLWLIKVDPSQMDQVILNLAVNARDAMRDGGTMAIETSNVHLDRAYASAHVDAEPGPYVLMSISDTGVGMDEQVKTHLFEPFFTTKEPGQGTGLGLATVFGIVKQSGGHIRVESELGRGTTFHLYLPRAGEATAEASVNRWPAQTSELGGGSETILVVEDKAAVRRLAVNVLELCGYQVLAAADGLEALAVSNHHPGEIHLLLTDVIMPHMKGPELAAKLRATRPELRVLFMSGYADDQILQEHDIGSTPIFLSKPFTVEDLSRKVRLVLDR